MQPHSHGQFLGFRTFRIVCQPLQQVELCKRLSFKMQEAALRIEAVKKLLDVWWVLKLRVVDDGFCRCHLHNLCTGEVGEESGQWTLLTITPLAVDSLGCQILGNDLRLKVTKAIQDRKERRVGKECRYWW